MANTLESIADFLAEALMPLTEVLDAADDDIAEFVEELGYILPTVPPALRDLQTASQNTIEAFTRLNDLQEDLAEGAQNDEELIIAFAALLVNVISFAVAINGLGNRLRTELPADFVNTTKVADDIEKRLLDRAFIETIADNIPLLYHILFFLGIVEITPQEHDPAKHQPEFELHEFRWERITDLFKDPAGLFSDVYGWGSPQLDTERLFEALEGLASYSFAVPEVHFPSDNFIAAVAPGAVVPVDEGPDPQLLVPLLQTDNASLSLLVYPLPTAGAEPQGLALTMTATGSLDLSLPLAENLTLELDASVALDSGIAIAMHPDQGASIVDNVTTDDPSGIISAGRIALKLVYQDGAGAEPLTIFESPDGSRLDVGQIYLSGGANMVRSDQFDAFGEFGLVDGQFVFGGGGDGFLSKILPQDGFKATFDLIAGVSRLDGFYLKGSGGLEIQLPVHLSLGPIEINGIYIILSLSDGKLPIEISSAISANLGPLSASVERLGLLVDLEFPGSGGNLGPLDVDLKFKPPNGVGLAIDAGVVKGGGYLFFDTEKEEYAGALELTFAEFLSLKAIGLITTRMPDGSKGFSLLAIITAEFGSGIQLGFGFALIGVGGLLGLNRTMRLEPLMEGVRTGAVNNIMFPTNVVENAPRIISDLRTIFPPEEGKFLIGPMAKLGWGTPTLINASLGIIIEIPGNIAILGVLKVALPDEDNSILLLQVSFAGAIEFDKKRIFFFASLYDSRVVFITIDGDMGLLVAWGANANFVVAVGGFHPRFNPPPLPFPNPHRLAVSILNKSNARIQVMGYFAVTSNTVQFGARAELFFGFSALSVSGHMAFDALFQFSPFYFIIQISASVSLKVFGMGLFSISLRFSLEGPAPWRAKGKGKISFLFFSISASFDITWGESRDTTVPPIEVMPLLKAELEKIENWEAQVLAANNLLVSLRQLEDQTGELVLHPVGALRISQRAVPMDITIDKVGSQKVKDANKFRLEVVADGLAKADDASEPFAIAQFQKMDDSQKLSRAAYEPEHSGLVLSAAGSQVASSRTVKRVVRYEAIIIDSNFKRFVQHFFVFFKGLFAHFLKANVVSKSVLSNKYKAKLQPFDEKIRVKSNVYTVAFNTDNKAVKDEATGFYSQAAAREYMQQQMTDDPGLAGKLHVIPEEEVNLAA